jgi:serine/threonine protein kinase
MNHNADAATVIWCASTTGPAIPWPSLPAPSSDDASRYDVGGVLGEGGMAVVFAAMDRLTGCEVAVKVARRDVAARYEQLLLNELAVLGHLEGTGLLPVLDSGTTAGGRPFFVMPLVDGVTLSGLIDEARASHPRLRRQLIRRRLLGVFDRICGALEGAHRAGIAHRDIKPRNILVSGYDDAYLVDWGLSGPVGAGYCGGGLEGEEVAPGGTPGYIAPEALRRGSDPLDVRADIWSLGAVLYEILTLRRAVPRASIPRMLAATLRGTHMPAIECEPDLVGGRALSEVVARALAPAPADRFASVAELRAAVRSALQRPIELVGIEESVSA